MIKYHNTNEKYTSRLSPSDLLYCNEMKRVERPPPPKKKTLKYLLSQNLQAKVILNLLFHTNTTPQRLLS